MITEGYLVRHYQGKRGGRGPALIDIAQDHLLFHLMQRGLFDLGIALKGGTAIRKLWAGSAGRFSTDLDFAGVDDTTADLLLEAVDGARVGGRGLRLISGPKPSVISPRGWTSPAGWRRWLGATRSCGT